MKYLGMKISDKTEIDGEMPPSEADVIKSFTKQYVKHMHDEYDNDFVSQQDQNIVKSLWRMSFK